METLETLDSNLSQSERLQTSAEIFDCNHRKTYVVVYPFIKWVFSKTTVCLIMTS